MMIIPEEGVKVLFAAAAAFGEKIRVRKQRVQLTGAHTGQAATIDNGWIIIEQKWYAKE